MGFAESLGLAFAAVFLRVGAAMALLPALGEQFVPARVRIVVTIALAVLITPVVHPLIVSVETDGLTLLLTESVVGLVFGIGLRLMIMALQIAGSIAAQATSLAQIFGNASVEPLPAIGHVLMMGGLALATIAGLHIKIVAALVETFYLFPPGQWLQNIALAEWGTSRIARCFTLGFTLAAPFVLTALLYNLALGVINKAMPQLMVALVGAPAITGAGLALLAVTAPYMLQLWWQTFDQLLQAPFTVY